MSDTPRTDAVKFWFSPDDRTLRKYDGQVVYAEFARTLERENSQLREALEGCAEAINLIFTVDDIEDKAPNGDTIGYSFHNHSSICRTLKKSLSHPAVQEILNKKH